MNSDIRSILTKHGLRITSPRLAVFNTLAGAASPLDMADIIRSCPDVDRVSIYRTIELFNRIGITVAVAHGWKYRYELAEPFRPHHHHLHCVGCGHVMEIESEQVESIIRQIGRAYRFQPTDHTFEINGLCSGCATHQAD